MKVIESIKQNQIYFIFDLFKWNLMLLIFVLIPSLYFSYLYIYINMHQHYWKNTPRRPNQIQQIYSQCLPPTSPMPPPSSHIHAKTHRDIADSIFCKTICLTFFFMSLQKIHCIIMESNIFLGIIFYIFHACKYCFYVYNLHYKFYSLKMIFVLIFLEFRIFTVFYVFLTIAYQKITRIFHKNIFCVSHTNKNYGFLIDFFFFFQNPRAFFIYYETKKAKKSDFSKSPHPPPPVSMRQKMSPEQLCNEP